MSNATKRPWKVDENGSICAVWEDGVEVQVAVMAHTHWSTDHDGGKGSALNRRITRETKANAALIVSAVNQHDALVAENQAMRAALEAVVKVGVLLQAGERNGYVMGAISTATDKAKAALAGGKGV